MRDVIWIDLNHEYRRGTIQCCICGIICDPGWGVPISMDTALIVANDYAGDWGSKPCCERCYHRHEAGEFVGTYPRH